MLFLKCIWTKASLVLPFGRDFALLAHYIMVSALRCILTCTGRAAQGRKAAKAAPLQVEADDSEEDGEENAAAPLIAMLGKISQEADR
jgi:hypothetical protein